jgi:hypothetical protein
VKKVLLGSSGRGTDFLFERGQPSVGCECGKRLSQALLGLFRL